MPRRSSKKGQDHHFYSKLSVGQRLRGGQNVSREFGGRQNVLQSVLSKTTFGGLGNRGWSGRFLFLKREMTESRQKRVGKRVVGGGSKNVFGEGFYAEFTVCFPTPLSFPPPFAALWSAPNHKSQIASDLKSRSPNRKSFPQIAVSAGSNRTFKLRDLWFEPLFKSPLESQCRFPAQVVRTMSFSEKVHSVSNR